MARIRVDPAIPWLIATARRWLFCETDDLPGTSGPSPLPFSSTRTLAGWGPLLPEPGAGPARFRLGGPGTPAVALVRLPLPPTTAISEKIWPAMAPRSEVTERAQSQVPLIQRFEANLTLSRRTLFLDDDPERGVEFRTLIPDAVWVETAADCIRALHEHGDELHLDHELGGEHFVRHNRDD